MSERTIRRSIFATVLAAFGMAGGSYRNFEKPYSADDLPKGKKIRHNYAQKAEARVKKVANWRKRNRIAARSRQMNRRSI